MQRATTDVLEISYETGGPRDGPPVFLLHGWPDDVRAWREVAPALHAAGYRTIVPYLRGVGPTRFLAPQTVRDARGVALAHDVIDLANHLEFKRFFVVGHDWGARVAYTLAALFPERVSGIVGIALAFQPRAEFTIPDFEQSRRFWYQWFMVLGQGAEAVRRDPKGFARIQWDTWSPPGWFDDAEFDATARSFENPDWAAITLHGYRARWLPEPVDARYAALLSRLSTIETLATPTLMIQGASDFCDLPSESAHMERFFTGGYKRVLLDDIGHFPMREAPEAVAKAVLAHFS